ncbi:MULTISPECIES: hypothetical protein [unclassified Streptomyces]|uniref:hypothetical protein n=1 Tax=unclassified Streptomyces TaxID=2593676 RepID=UPI00382F22DC
MSFKKSAKISTTLAAVALLGAMTAPMASGQTARSLAAGGCRETGVSGQHGWGKGCWANGGAQVRLATDCNGASGEQYSEWKSGDEMDLQTSDCSFWWNARYTRVEVRQP